MLTYFLVNTIKRKNFIIWTFVSIEQAQKQLDLFGLAVSEVYG